MTKPKRYALTFTLQEVLDVWSAITFTLERIPKEADRLRMSLHAVTDRLQAIVPKLKKLERQG